MGTESSLTQNLTSTSPNLRPCTPRRDEKETRHYCFHRLFLDDAPFSCLSHYFKTSEYNYFSKNRLLFWHFKKMYAHVNYGPTLSLSTSSSFILFYFKLINLFYNIVLVLPYIDLNPPWVYMCSPSWIPLLPPFPSHPSGSSQRTSPEHPVTCIEPGLAICFTYDKLHVSMPFSHIIPPLPSTESERLFNTSVSLLLSRLQGYHYYLSKSHVYASVDCIGVFLSGLLHSVYCCKHLYSFKLSSSSNL